MKGANKVTLPKAIKQHYADVELSGDQLEQLTTLGQRQQSEQQTDRSQTQRQDDAYTNSWWTTLLSWLQGHRYPVAAALVIITIAITTPFLGGGNILNQVVDEVAYNHNKQMTMEIETANLDEITSYLSKLGFALIGSHELSTIEWEILGGRYCSIQGKLAAQLKVRNREDNRTYTFYQALMPQQMANIGQVENYVDGVKVVLWQEQGLLLGLAGNPAESMSDSP